MEFARVFLVFWLLVIGYIGGDAAVMGARDDSRKCRFPAIFNFGDSNSDTGGRSAALMEVPPPNGETFFGEPSGRFCDGRLIIDFIAKKLGLPYLNAYLDSIGTSFKHGANFATGGSLIRPGSYSPFHLGIQISQFTQFKSRTTALYKQLSDRKEADFNLPRPEDFTKALYTMDIGQNDLAYGFQNTTEEQVRASIPDILNQFSQAVHQLYNEGARFFWVHNTAPIGCLPYKYYNTSKAGSLDRNGCVEPQNKVAQEFNKQLKDRITMFNAELQDAAFTYVDVYSAKYALISNAVNQGFEEPLRFCCGSFDPVPLFCGTRLEVNGTTYHGSACDDPSRYISWDGIHYSEAANLWIAARILNGSLSDPPVSIEEACL